MATETSTATSIARARYPTPNSPRGDKRRRSDLETDENIQRKAPAGAMDSKIAEAEQRFAIAFPSPVSVTYESDDDGESFPLEQTSDDIAGTPATQLPQEMAHATLLPLAHLLLSSLFPATPSQSLYPLTGFLKEMVSRSGTSPETLALGLLYLWRCRDRIARNRAVVQPSLKSTASTIAHPSLCARRMFLSALIIAWKFLSDRTYTNSAWAKISGLQTEEINRNERVLLGMLGWTLDCKPVEWFGWSEWIESMRGEVEEVVRADTKSVQLELKIPVTIQGIVRQGRESDEDTLQGSPNIYGY